MKLLFVTFLISITLSAKFVAPELIEDEIAPSVDFSEDLKNMSEMLKQGNWLGLIPTTMSLISKVKEQIKESHTVSTILALTGGNNECPYQKCVKKRFHKACKVGKLFAHLVWHGKQKKARKALKCLTKILDWTTRCPKKKEL